ncbi:hypothetical protein [Sorangium sp. So ce394]|uniref:hypothetical protein n=1 Tax=Sorangium sp. So ce394 TaxID=3133310 RepID=UPI003F5C5BED
MWHAAQGWAAAGDARCSVRVDCISSAVDRPRAVGNANSWQAAHASAPPNRASRITVCGAAGGAPLPAHGAASTGATAGPASSPSPSLVTWHVTHPTPSTPSASGSGSSGLASGAWQARQNGIGSIANARR